MDTHQPRRWMFAALNVTSFMFLDLTPAVCYLVDSVVCHFVVPSMLANDLLIPSHNRLDVDLWRL